MVWSKTSVAVIFNTHKTIISYIVMTWWGGRRGHSLPNFSSHLFNSRLRKCRQSLTDRLLLHCWHCIRDTPTPTPPLPLLVCLSAPHPQWGTSPFRRAPKSRPSIMFSPLDSLLLPPLPASLLTSLHPSNGQGPYHGNPELGGSSGLHFLCQCSGGLTGKRCSWYPKWAFWTHFFPIEMLFSKVARMKSTISSAVELHYV